ncbi:ZIP family metal transporter [Variovorax sp. PCZ-1]|uniref:ZIP family metal transporter n=1 Tax=Variovorax sp. PCZ-1 TaxID=2835533 RepID=UPI001BCBD1D0|nr:ZIP family metal transporter [Variovorax sp. PCZ-1]MBS7808471.1 ZIP family metal transporter [Variovorax sp. PCZ-1]
MTLLSILLGTLAAGVGSVLVAALLTYGVLARFTQHLLSLAAGALLATAFMHLLPEAINSSADAKDLFAVLLGCLIFFFLLDKAELYHHGHEHHHGHSHDHAHHDHSHTHHEESKPSGGWAVLVGDSVHCFGDGILIASAFIADFRLGLVASLAVLAHEVPHHMGDLVVLRQTETSANPALLKLCMAGGVTVLGGLVGYFLVAQLQDLLPFMLVVASGSFIYVALADLIPQLQTRLSLKATAAQVAWLAVGIVLVTVVSGLAH